MFDNGSEFNWDFTPFLNNSNIKPVLKKIKNPQDNDLMERVHQVVLNMLATKDLEYCVWVKNSAYMNTLGRDVGWHVDTIV